MRLAAGRPVHVGPITLARRFNAVATSGPGRPETNADRATDPLLDTDLAAAWTVASVSALSGAGVASLCYFETTGARGIRGGEGAEPVAAVLDELARTRDRPLLKVHAPTDLAALAIGARPGTAMVMVADLSGRARTVTVRRDPSTERLHLSAWGLRRLGGHASDLTGHGGRAERLVTMAGKMDRQNLGDVAVCRRGGRARTGRAGGVSAVGSEGGHAAVDREEGAGGVAGLVAGQVDHDAFDVRGPTWPAERDPRNDAARSSAWPEIALTSGVSV